MKWKALVFAVAVLVTVSATGYAQVDILRNNDVLVMAKNGMTSEKIIEKIEASSCAFDIFPPVLEDLHRRGVPNEVLEVMTLVPNGPPRLALPDNTNPDSPATAAVKIAQGSQVVVETLYPISSANFKVGNTISFAVVNPVYVNNVLVIPRGTIAKAKIVNLKQAQFFGRGGVLAWEMERIVGIDGTSIPVQLASTSVGGNRAGEAAAGAALTSALVFPYTAPAALVWGFKKGSDAVVRGNRKFSAIVKADTEVVGVIPDQERVTFHYAESLKAKMNSTSTPTVFPRLGIRY